MSDVIFWHGWGMHPSVWNSLINLLDRMRAGESLLMAEPLPGYDGSIAPRPYSAEAVVDSLLGRSHKRIALCGWSLGAMLAILAACRHPEKVERLILIGATPSFVRREDWDHAMDQGVLEEFADAAATHPSLTLRRFTALFNRNDSNARIIARQLASLEIPSDHALEDGLALLRETDLRPIVSSISQPVLLIHGEHDPLMPPSAAQWLADTLPDARLEIIPNAAHAPFLSDPARCAALISDFLDE